jgi:uncharacterized membrane protein
MILRNSVKKDPTMSSLLFGGHGVQEKLPAQQVAAATHKLFLSSKGDPDTLMEPPTLILSAVGGATLAALFHLVGRFALPNSKLIKDISRIALALFMLGGAVLLTDKAIIRDILLPMVQPPLPQKLCVYASLFELLCAVLLLVPSMQTLGAKFTFALLLGVWPSNIHVAVSKKAHDESLVKTPQGSLNCRYQYSI